MSDVWICASCGDSVSAEGRFCGGCGTPAPEPAEVNALAEQPVPAEAPPTVVIRRDRAGSRFLPRQAPVPEGGVIVGRNVLASRVTTKPQTSRERKVAGELPEWEPLPPGELLVRRPGA
jgi:hypothetical protein